MWNEGMSQVISFSDAQLARVMQAAERIAPRYRNRFLENVVDRLFATEITDTSVLEAVRHVACSFEVGVE